MIFKFTVYSADPDIEQTISSIGACTFWRDLNSLKSFYEKCSLYIKQFDKYEVTLNKPETKNLRMMYSYQDLKKQGYDGCLEGNVVSVFYPEKIKFIEKVK